MCLLLVLLTVGCGNKTKEDAQEACREFREVVTEADARCTDVTVEESEALFDSELDCSDVKRLRDQDEFYDECLPELEALSCAELNALLVPESCEDQLLY